MVLGAQNPSRIVDLHHLVVLINSTTSVSIDRKKVFIDDLWGLVSDLWRLVDRGHKLRERIIGRSLWGCIELSDHLPNRMPEE